jgi:hypothetical protein
MELFAFALLIALLALLALILLVKPLSGAGASPAEVLAGTVARAMDRLRGAMGRGLRPRTPASSESAVHVQPVDSIRRRLGLGDEQTVARPGVSPDTTPRPSARPRDVRLERLPVANPRLRLWRDSSMALLAIAIVLLVATRVLPSVGLPAPTEPDSLGNDPVAGSSPTPTVGALPSARPSVLQDGVTPPPVTPPSPDMSPGVLAATSTPTLGPTARPAPKPTPTRRPAATRTPRPTSTASPSPSPLPTPEPTPGTSPGPTPDPTTTPVATPTPTPLDPTPEPPAAP